MAPGPQDRLLEVGSRIAADAVAGTAADKVADTAADKVAGKFADTAESLQLDFGRPVQVLRWESAEPTAPQMMQILQRQQAQQRLRQVPEWEPTEVALLLPRI